MISLKLLRGKCVRHLPAPPTVLSPIPRHHVPEASAFEHGYRNPSQEKSCLLQTAKFSSHSSYGDSGQFENRSGLNEISASDLEPAAVVEAIPLCNALDEEAYPVGRLTLEEFFGFEEELKSLIAIEQQSQTTIQQSFMLLGRLVQEHDAQPEILEAEWGMRHWIRGKYPRSTKRLDQILRNWVRYLEQSSGDEDLTPDVVLSLVDGLRSGDPPLHLTDETFRIIMEGATRGGHPREAPLFADRLLDRLVEESMENPLLRPSAATMQTVLTAWARSGLPQAPQKAESLFKAMAKLYEDCITERAPDNATYLTMMQVWRNSDDSNAPQKVEEILEMMKRSTFEDAQPSQGGYRMTIHSWINSGDPQAIARAYDLFVELVKTYMDDKQQYATIDGDFFSIMISALAKTGEFDKAMEVFHLMEKLHKTTGDRRFEPCTKTMLGMLISYSKSQKPGMLEKAESLLLQLDDLALKGAADEDLPPKRSYYSKVVNALGKRRSRDEIERAEKLISRMVAHHRAGVPNMLPNAGFFDQLIIAWSHSKATDAPLRAEGLLRVMQQLAKETQRNDIKPSEKTYLLAMTAWSRSRNQNSAVRAEKLFFEMLDEFNKGDGSMKPSMAHYTSLISAWGRSDHPDAPVRAQQAFEAVKGFYEEGDKSFEPDCYVYTTLMQAWASVGDGNAVESIFLQLYEEYIATKRKNMMPSVQSFNVLLEAWNRGRHPQAYHKAKLVFDSMIEFTRDGTLDAVPNIPTYAKMTEIASYSGLPDAGEQAEAYLEKLKADPVFYESHRHKKVFNCYVFTIQAWTRSRGKETGSKVESLTDELISLSKSGKIPLPSQSDHRLFLKALAHSQVPSLATTAQQVLELKGNYKITSDLLP